MTRVLIVLLAVFGVVHEAWAQGGPSATTVSVIFFVAGVVGAGLKSYLANDQTTLSKKSLGDVILGGIGGILLPLVTPLPAGTTVIQQAAIVAALSYVGVDVIQNALQKFGITLPGSPPPKP
jgi:phosphate/sulfate permease